MGIMLAIFGDVNINCMSIKLGILVRYGVGIDRSADGTTNATAMVLGWFRDFARSTSSGRLNAFHSFSIYLFIAL